MGNVYYSVGGRDEKKKKKGEKPSLQTINCFECEYSYLAWENKFYWQNIKNRNSSSNRAFKY